MVIIDLQHKKQITDQFTSDFVNLQAQIVNLQADLCLGCLYIPSTFYIYPKYTDILNPYHTGKWWLSGKQCKS